jgi:MerR family transcriptional regulator, heat shock protein HspR
VVPRGRRVRRGKIRVEETVVERPDGGRRTLTSGALVLWRPHRGDRD